MGTLTKEEIKAIAARGYEDPVWFCKFFLEHWFPGRIPWIHRGILAILLRRCQFLLNFDDDYAPEDLKRIVKNFVWKEDPNDPASPELPIFTWDGTSVGMTLSKNTLLLLPRGAAKTTLVNAANIIDICYQVYEFFVYISHAQPHASQQLTNIGKEFAGNSRLMAVFGQLKPPERDGERWSESLGLIQTTTGVSVLSRGITGQLRGLNINGVRPKRIIFDDIEDKENVSSEEQRAKMRDRVFGDALPSLAKLDPSSHAIALGTLLGRDSLLSTIMSDPDWTSIIFGATDRDGLPIWPEWMDEKKLEREKQSFATKGLLHLYYLEYFNTIRGEGTEKFRQDQIVIEPVALEDVPFRAMVLDPAISTKAGSDFSSITVAGFRKDGKIQVLDNWMKQGATVREQIDKYFEMHYTWFGTADQLKHGVESVGFQRMLIGTMQEEMFRQGKEHGAKAYFEIIPISQPSDVRKDDRILAALQPRFAAGYIRFQRRMPQLETQLLDFPRGKKDGPDSLAMVIKLLEDFFVMAGGEDAMTKDEYEPLDVVFKGDWRNF